jgi:hypothetical protein
MPPDSGLGPRTRARPAPAGRRPPRSTQLGWLWGTRPGRLGVFTILIGTALGVVVTLLAGAGPGWLLGIFLLAATAVAAFAVRPRAVYLIIPVPAPSYLVAAMFTGLIHDRGIDTTHTILAANAVQWIASGFIAMTLATALAGLVALGRWAAERRAVRRGRAR